MGEDQDGALRRDPRNKVHKKIKRTYEGRIEEGEKTRNSSLIEKQREKGVPIWVDEKKNVNKQGRMKKVWTLWEIKKN
jgi:hypothetical protein